MSRIYNPPEPHACKLSGAGHWVPKDLRRGAVEVCDECGAAWVYDPIPWERTYRSVRPWPFDCTARRVLRANRNTPVKHDGEADR